MVIIGAGETSELTARALAEQGAGTIFVANRHADRALSARPALRRLGRRASSGLPEQLLRADIVLASTSSPHPIVGRDELELVMEQRGGRPLLLIDIAVPRDIDPPARELEGVTLYDIDDLQAVVARNLSSRAERDPAGARDRRGGDPPLRPLARPARRAARRSRRCASTATRSSSRCSPRTRERWESASPRDLARVEAIARAVASRLLHEPTIRLRSLDGERGHASLELLRELFALRRNACAARRSSPRRSWREVHDLRRRRRER